MLLPSMSTSSLLFVILPSKKEPTASSPDAKLVATLNRSFALEGGLRPSSCTRLLHVVPYRKALMTSESAMLGSSVHCLEKRRM